MTDVERKLAHLGGKMYGDGRYVVIFNGGVPLSVTVYDRTRDDVEVRITSRFRGPERPSMRLAADAIKEAERVLAEVDEGLRYCPECEKGEAHDHESGVSA